MANVKPSGFGSAITPASTTILVGELADGTAGRFTADDLPVSAAVTTALGGKADASSLGALAYLGYTGLWKSGAGAPTASADYPGQTYIKTGAPAAVYQAQGTAVGSGAADWTLITNLATGADGSVLTVVSGAEAWLTLAANQMLVKNSANTAAEARTQKRAYGISMAITADGTYQLPVWPDMPCTGVDVQSHTWGGTCSIKIQKGGADINGYGSAVAQTTTPTTTTSTETYTKGNKIQVVVSSASSLTGLVFTINAVQTGN